MRRDMDLVRTLLLRLEALNVGVDDMAVISAADERVEVDGRSSEEIGHHLAWIAEAGLIIGEMMGPYNAITFARLSWQGCDFLETVRDPEVWKRTKAGASSVGGIGFGLIKDMATAYAKHVAKERLGLDL